MASKPCGYAAACAWSAGAGPLLCPECSRDQCASLSAELSAAREMREVLRELEWSGIINDYDYCPVCNGGYQDHRSDCRLARLIGGGE